MRFRSLTTLLTTAFIAMAVLPMTAVLVLSSKTALAENEAASGSSLAMMADNTLDIMYRNLFERYGDVQAFAMNPTAVAMDAEQLTTVADAYTDLYDFYDLMVISDLQGRIVAVNRHDLNGKPLPAAQALIGQSLATQPWFATAMATPAGTSDYADVERNQMVAAATGETGESLRFSAPIRRGNTVVGLWTNFASWKRVILGIKEVVQAPLASQQITLTLLDRTGRVLIDGNDPSGWRSIWPRLASRRR
jgi:hypothetical protein